MALKAGAWKADRHFPPSSDLCISGYLLIKRIPLNRFFNNLKKYFPGSLSWLKKREPFRCHYGWMNGPVEKLLC
jgi:hypothetical protein